MRRLLVPAAILVLVACGDDGSRDEAAGTVATVTTDDAANTRPTLSESPRHVPPVVPPSVEGTAGSPLAHDHRLVVGAVADLAARLGLDPAAVSVVDARAVTWGDRSLGCPQPGMNYPQVLVDGTLVVLEAGGRRYEYHGGDPLFLCEQPKPPSGG